MVLTLGALPTGEPALDYFQCFLCIVIISVTVWASQERPGSLEEIHSSVPSLIRVCRKCWIYMLLSPALLFPRAQFQFPPLGSKVWIH